MDWFQNKTTQIIALVGIVGTLAGFGYTGAEYVNRLENLEAKSIKRSMSPNRSLRKNSIIKVSKTLRNGNFNQ